MTSHIGSLESGIESSLFNLENDLLGAYLRKAAF